MARFNDADCFPADPSPAREEVRAGLCFLSRPRIIGRDGRGERRAERADSSIVSVRDGLSVPKWRRLFWAAFGFGAGVASTLTLVAIGVGWYMSRPVPPKPWGRTEVTARFDGLTRTADGTITLEFAATNHVARDYRITSAEQVTIMARHHSGLVQGRDALTMDLPVFIPAGQTVTISITMHGYQDPKAPETREAALQYMHSNWKNFAGFTLFDVSNRYQIDLPV